MSWDAETNDFILVVDIDKVQYVLLKRISADPRLGIN
jgi:hypothetical protein